MFLRFPFLWLKNGLLYIVARTTDTQWRHKSKISEKLGQCGRQNMLWPYLKIWDWDWIFGRAVKAVSSLGVRSPWYQRSLKCCLFQIGVHWFNYQVLKSPSQWHNMLVSIADSKKMGGWAKLNRKKNSLAGCWVPWNFQIEVLLLRKNHCLFPSPAHYGLGHYWNQNRA
jgi:hypothetical protein